MSNPKTIDARLQTTVGLRNQFAAKVRGARAVTGWSQRELAEKVGMTQKTIHRIEQGLVDVRQSTATLLEAVFIHEGIRFRQRGHLGFEIVVSDPLEEDGEKDADR